MKIDDEIHLRTLTSSSLRYIYTINSLQSNYNATPSYSASNVLYVVDSPWEMGALSLCFQLSNYIILFSFKYHQLFAFAGMVHILVFACNVSLSVLPQDFPW